MIILQMHEKKKTNKQAFHYIVTIIKLLDYILVKLQYCIDHALSIVCMEAQLKQTEVITI